MSSATQSQLLEQACATFTPNVKPRRVFVRGEGARLWDVDGQEYVDFIAGIGVNSYGHCHPALVEALRSQAARLLHVSNLYLAPPVLELASELLRLSGGQRVFFTNSGTEAIEAGIKLARLYFRRLRGEDRPEIIATVGAFHGRTMGALACTGTPKYHKGFEPLLGGVTHVPYGDAEAVARACGPQTAAILVEPVQGEGGVIVPPPGYLAALRGIADRCGCLLFLDEVQTGMGRTGPLFAHQAAPGCRPDLLALAKGLGGGLPLGGLVAFGPAAEGFVPGSHGSTMGGNPLACAVGLVGLRLLTGGLLEQAQQRGQRLRAELEALVARQSVPGLLGVRGAGLMLGLLLDRPAGEAMDRCLDQGLLANTAGTKVLRLLPPLVLGDQDISEGLVRLERALSLAAGRPGSDGRAA